jgi:aspartate beta-hydroxylase
MSTASIDAQVRQLIEAAQRAHSTGQPAEAGRLIGQAQTLAPEHPLVLNALGMRALNSGDASGARRILEKAVRVAPDLPALYFSLALTCRALSDAEAEMAALDKALTLDPYFFLALLQKATLLERSGKPRQAATAYGNVLACAPNPSQLPPALQNALTHARNAVKANNDALDAFIRARTAAARAAHAGERLDRVDDCIGAMVGKNRIYVQEPTFMHFPRLPAIQFYDRSEFPWLAAFEAATDDIRAELLQLLKDDSGFVPYVAHPDGVPLNQWQELNRSRRWSAYFLWREGKQLDDHVARCPKTVAAMANVPRIDVPGHAPTVFFSILEPKTRIPSHSGVTNTRLVVHLPLIVPPGCRFRVGTETREWKAGEAWVFDDTIEHEAFNDSDEPRAILICDIWNPYLTPAERDMVSAATAGIQEFYEGDLPGRPAGGKSTL